MCPLANVPDDMTLSVAAARGRDRQGLSLWTKRAAWWVLPGPCLNLLSGGSSVQGPLHESHLRFVWGTMKNPIGLCTATQGPAWLVPLQAGLGLALGGGHGLHLQQEQFAEGEGEAVDTYPVSGIMEQVRGGVGSQVPTPDLPRAGC